MQLKYVIHYVSNVGETIEFYQKAFGLETQFVHDSGAYAELSTGGTSLAFADEKLVSKTFDFQLNRKENATPGSEVGFVTQDVESAFKRAIDGGATIVAPPAQKPWGQIVSYVRDLNGCLVEICSPIGG